MRLGIYVDLTYRKDSAGVSAPLSFISWILGLAEHVDELVIFGRVSPHSGRAAYAVSGPRVRFVSLPFYENLRRPASVAAAVPASARRWGGELRQLDAVMLFGPHPIAIIFGIQARAAGIPVFVGVRQDFRQYVAHRIRGRSARWTLPAALVLEAAHRRMVRWGGAIVVGDELGRRYEGRGRRVLVTGVSLVRSEDLAPVAIAAQRPWPGTRRALAVGRLDPEKNPLLLADVLAALRRRDPWSLTVAGTGSLESQLLHRARAASCGDALHLVGQVDGESLRDLYRRSTVLIHLSWTEGVPQVLFEAAAAGIPIVATAVGGVPGALQAGRFGLLVPPGDAEAVVRAVDRLGQAPDERIAMVAAARRWAANETLEQQAKRVARFVTEATCQGSSRRRR